MRNFRFDYRWIILIIVVLVLANARWLPWPLVAVMLAGGGGYLIVWGWKIWNRGLTSRMTPRVQYWRGQRYVEPAPKRPALPPLREIGPAAIPLLLGGTFLLVAVTIVVERLNI